MATMYDSVTAANIPPTAEIVAGYIDGLYAWSDADWARFPLALKVTIAVFAVDDADVLDVEHGDATPAEAPAWVLRQRARGADPTVYVSFDNLLAVADAFDAAGVEYPRWWIADYQTPPVPRLIPGSAATQYEDAGPYDLSITDGVWPASPPKPKPPTLEEGADMFCTDPESGTILATDPDGNLFANPGALPAVPTLSQHPSYHAGAAESGGANPCVGICMWRDPVMSWGVCFVTKPAGRGSFGPYDLYRFTRAGAPA